ncbi:LOB domain-containing protein 16 [Apium graveolens]|uniref:LOB domain-containing protein 16 n=1 Tax=Apium graveolens TaxID=4045 RepID=UPI003D7BA470
MATSGTSSPCGACKFLRRKCATDCIFAPYFTSEQGPARFAAIHKVFGASNVSKLLCSIPVADRCEAVVTIAYEAQARIKDPVYGCVSHIYALQQQVASLQSQVMQVKSQMAQGLMESRNHEENLWQAGNYMTGTSISYPGYNFMNNNYVSPQSSPESINHYHDNKEGVMSLEDIQNRHDQLISLQNPSNYGRKRPSGSHIDQLGELQELASRMMNN